MGRDWNSRVCKTDSKSPRLIYKKNTLRNDTIARMAVHTCNPSIQEAEAGEW
jgi:hypothetical protein